MAADDQDNEDQESGSTLRAKLEASIAEANALRETAAEATVKGFKYVKPSDLAGVAPKEMASKALEIEAAKAAERDTLLREALAERGLTDDQLDEALGKLAGGEKPDSEPTAADRVASLGQLAGSAPRPPENVGTGDSRIRAAIASKKK